MLASDAQVDPPLSAALTREAAPSALAADVESRLAAVASVPGPLPSGKDRFVPSFASLQITTKSRWTSLLSLGAHAFLCSLIVLFALNQWHLRQAQKKLLATTVDVAPY